MLVKDGNTITIKLENDTGIEKAARIMRAALKDPTPWEKPEDDGSKIWSIADTGSSVTGADCSVAFPKHRVKSSKHQRKNASYMAADGGNLKHEGEVKVVHLTDQGDKVDITVQNIKTPIPRLSIRKFAHRGCTASFWKGGGRSSLTAASSYPSSSAWVCTFVS